MRSRAINSIAAEGDRVRQEAPHADESIIDQRAAELLGLPLPPAEDYATAEMTPMARSFYAESKRVSNRRMRQDLGVELLFPDYRSGLAALLAAASGCATGAGGVIARVVAALAAVLRARGIERVAVEDPGYPSLRRVPERLGPEVLPVDRLAVDPGAAE